jgi:HEAT repeat protein
LIKELNGKKSALAKIGVIQALGNTGDPRIIDPLIALLKDENQAVRVLTVQALGNTKDPRIVDPLIALLKDESQGVRVVTVQALGNTKDPRIVDPLIALLKDESQGVRTVTVQALGEIQDPRTTEPLIAVLKGDVSDDVRVLAALALCTDKIATLKDKYANLRLLSAAALGNFKDPRVIDALNAALQDTDDRVRAQAAESLKKIK